MPERDKPDGRWIPVKPDSRGYTDEFDCSVCGGSVHLGFYAKECDYIYCPWCGNFMEDTDEVSGNA